MCKWTNRDGAWGGDSQGVLLFRMAEFMSVSFLVVLFSFLFSFYFFASFRLNLVCSFFFDSSFLLYSCAASRI